MTPLPRKASAPRPAIDATTSAHWEGLRRGALVIRRCRGCGTLDHPVALQCRTCGAAALEWVDVGDQVSLFSWVVEERAVVPGMAPPYTVVQVVPQGCDEDGVRIVGLTDCAPDQLSIGMEMRLRPRPAAAGDVVLGFYAPA